MTTPVPPLRPEPPPSGLRGLWAAFRGLPTWAQVVLAVLLWPAYLTVLILVSDRGTPPARYAAATLVLVVGIAIWVPSADDAGPQAGLTADVATVGQAREASAEAAAEQRADRAAAELRDREAAAREAAAREAETREAETREAERREAQERVRREAEASASAAAEAVAAAARGWTVINVVDGDTVDVRHADGTEERVRVTGIDTPERGECGFDAATDAMAALVLDRDVELPAGARDDRDRYDRILRYVDVDGVDAGLALIEDGLAIARYDSRDGYGRHPREARYVAADAATDSTCTPPPPAPTPAPTPTPAPSTSGPGTGPGGAYRNCTEARALGGAPVNRGQPGYGTHLDRDRDGIGCE